MPEAPTPLQLPTRGSTRAAIVGFVLIVVALGAMRFAVARGLPGVVDLTIMVAAAFAPLIAAITVTAATMRLEGLRDLRARIADWRIHPGWYVLGLGLPVVVYSSVLAVYVAAGGPRPVFETALLVVVAEILVVGFVLFLVEEVGWRGWLQRALQARVSGLAAALLVGVVWAVWHVPLLSVQGAAQAEISLAAFVPLILAVSVVFAWIYNATGGSVLAVVVAHTGFNLGVGPAAASLPDGANTFIALCAAVTAAAAAILAVVAGPRLRGPGENRAI